MKSQRVGALVLLCCATLSFDAAAADAPRTFSFDNGAGLAGTSTHYRFDSRHGDFLPHAGTPVSRYLLHQRYGAGVLHYGGTLAEDEQHYYGGVSLGRATVAYFQGEAESFSKASNPLYRDLNQYFFHGGSRSTFRFQGLGASIVLPGGLSTQLAYSEVSAPRVDDRHGYYAGIGNGTFEAGVFQLNRGGDKVGDGLNLGVGRGGLDLSYQEIRSDYGARVRRLALQWDTGPSIGVSLELEQAENDLYAAGDEQRVMLRFRRSLGRTPAFAAAEEGGESGKQPRFGKAVGIGVGLGAAAVALSSGGDSDGTPRFAVRNDAASHVLNRINPVSVRQNREHGGWVYRNADNTFSHTRPVAGTIDSVNIGNPVSSVPTGTVASASYHTHGGPDPRYDNENFSPQDLLSDRLAGVDGYLGTPAGFMKLHDVETNSISVVGRINN